MFQQDSGFSKILDSNLTEYNMKNCNLVISWYWFIKTISLSLHLLVNSHIRFYDIMGNYITRPVSSSNKINPSRNYGHPSNLKSEYQNIIKLLRGIEYWQKWKSRTECPFDGSGYYRVLSDALFSENNQQMNRKIWS